jgi:hypothetical protein
LGLLAAIALISRGTSSAETKTETVAERAARIFGPPQSAFLQSVTALARLTHPLEPERRRLREFVMLRLGERLSFEGQTAHVDVSVELDGPGTLKRLEWESGREERHRRNQELGLTSCEFISFNDVSLHVELQTHGLNRNQKLALARLVERACPLPGALVYGVITACQTCDGPTEQAEEPLTFDPATFALEREAEEGCVEASYVVVE